MNKREKAVILTMRIIGALLIAFGLYTMLIVPQLIGFAAFGGILLVLAYGKKCDYLYEAEQREIRRQKRQADATAQPPQQQPSNK